jgi:hypothetical protein
MSKMVAMRNSSFRATLPRPVVARGRGPTLASGTKSRTELGSNLGDLEAVGPWSAMRFTGAHFFMTSSTALSVGP